MTTHNPPALRLLGRVEYDDDPLPIPRKARALLAYIAVANTPLPRDRLAATFCHEAADPRRTLRTLLSHIRRAAPDLLHEEDNHVALAPNVWLDCHALAEAVERRAVSASTPALYRGEFLAREALPTLPEFELWLLSRRFHYKSLYESALLHLARAQLAAGQLAAAGDYAADLVHSNPYLEEGQALLVQILVARGQRAAARGQYAQFQELLLGELGIAPAATFEQMASATPQLSAGHADAARRPRRRPLLFDPQRLDRWLPEQQNPARLRRLYDWALATAATAATLAAHHDAAAALDTALFAGARLALPPAEQAALLLRRALLAEHVDDTPAAQQAMLAQAETLLGPTPAPDATRLLTLARAGLFYRQGRYAKAIAHAVEGAAAFERSGEARYAGHALAIKGSAESRTGQNPAAIASLQTAESWFAAAGEGEGRAVCRGETAWAYLNLGRVAEAFAAVGRALETLGPALTPAAAGRLYYTRAACWNYYYEPAELEANARRAIDHYTRAGNAAMANRCRIYLVQALRYRLRPDEAQKLMAEILQAGERYDDTWLMAWIMALLALSAFKRNRLDDAGRWYQRTYGLRRQTGERPNQVYDLAWTGRLHAATGRLDSALRYTTAAVRQMEQAAGDYFVWEAWDMRLAHAEVLAQLNRPGEAARQLARAAETLKAFAATIPDPRHRDLVLTFENSRHLLAAHESGRIIPFHLREHTVI